MKTVVNSKQVAHLWANKSQSQAKNSNGSLYFSGDTIYSYGSHFPIARHVSTPNGEAVLFTSDTYSVTTAKHKSYVSQAASHLNVIEVASFDGNHEKNFKAFLSELNYRNGKLQRARTDKWHWQSYIQRYADNIRRYAELYSVDIPAEVLTAIEYHTSPEVNEAIATIESEAPQRAARKAELERTKIQRSLENWKEGKTRSLPRNRTGFSYLRVNRTTNEVETSGGIRLSPHLARSLYVRIKLAIAFKDFASVVGTKVLNGFTVRSLSPEQFVVGCHTIPMTEVEEVANHFGWEAPTTF